MPTIRFKTSDREVNFPEGDEVNLLRVAIRNECDVPFKCASGNCGTDRVHVESGAEHLSAPRKRERDRLGELLDQGWRLACQTYVTGDVTLTWDPDQQALDGSRKELSDRAESQLRRSWLAKGDAE
jgi:ferredoxin